MGKHPFAFLDVETTGHDPLRRVKGRLVAWHEIIDIGCVRVDPVTLQVLDEFQWKVRPRHPERCIPNIINNYPARAAAGEWDKATGISEAINRLLGFIEPRAGRDVAVVGGQNFFFDWTFMTVAFALAGYEQDTITKEYLHYSRFDTRSMAIQELWEPGTPYEPSDWSIRSSLLVEKLGLEPEPPVHTAINGARKSFEVFKRLVELKGERLRAR